MSEIEHVDLHAERMAGFDRRPASKAPARRRARVQQAPTDLPRVDGKFFVRLDRGEIYSLAHPDLTFTKGKAVEVSAEVHAYLMNAVDVLPTVRDPEYGRVVRHKRKFSASPAYPPIPDSYPDCD